MLRVAVAVQHEGMERMEGMGGMGGMGVLVHQVVKAANVPDGEGLMGAAGAALAGRIWAYGTTGSWGRAVACLYDRTAGDHGGGRESQGAREMPRERKPWPRWHIELGFRLSRDRARAGEQQRGGCHRSTDCSSMWLTGKRLHHY